MYAGLFGDGNRLFDLNDRALEALLVSDAVADDARHEEHTRGAVGFRIAQAEQESFKPNFARGFIRRGKRFLPMRVAANARSLPAARLEGGEHFLAIHAAHRLYTFEPRFFHGAELIENAPLH